MASATMVIECKNCEARYKIPTTFTGHKFICKRCHSPVFVKSRTTTKRRPTMRRYTRVKGNPRPQKVSPLLYLSGVACIVLLAAVVIYLVM